MTRANDLILLVGRCAIAALFLPGGIQKLMNYNAFAAQLGGRGLPFGWSLPHPEIFAMLAVAIEVIGPLLILLGIQTRWAALLMAGFVIMATATSHRYWEFADAAAYRVQSSNFYKNIGIFGGLLFLHVAGAGAFSWDQRRRQPKVLL
jgi:putative oxidoreductase